MEETRLARREKAALIPLWDVVVVTGLLVSHRLTCIFRARIVAEGLDVDPHEDTFRVDFVQ